MTIRLEIDTAFAVRPKKGERRATDGSGRMMKTSIVFADTLEAALAEARATAAAGAAMAPGYAEVLAVRAFDAATFSADPLAAVPTFTAATL